MRGERRNKQANELKASAHPGLAAEPRPGGEGPGGEDSKTWDPEDLFYPEVILRWQLIEELGQAHKPQYPYKSEGFRRVPRKDSDNPGTMGQNGLFQVIGVDDSQSFQNLSHWKKEFIYYTDVKRAQKLSFCHFGNKTGISEQQVSAEEAQAWCRDNGNYPKSEKCAKDATNVTAAFEEAVQRVLATEDRRDHLIQTDTVKSALKAQA
ncbi:hypothetical protein QTO34_003396 [Cnephaeus nilssonii]|uniref:Uncharacterized protein n=1 Tax=Cnephaeus nilssonii TaxID=3371016 RepID=A0AA40HQJ5_CNENI|nr:hypothetical protein QTO34_003396 [Eptesicus nilssonii]